MTDEKLAPVCPICAARHWNWEDHQFQPIRPLPDEIPPPVPRDESDVLIVKEKKAFMLVENKKRGRPPLFGTAMSAKERQARFLARKAHKANTGIMQ